jgi:hypothetical protein
MNKAIAVVAAALVAVGAQAQVAPTNFDQAAYVTCREANGMQADARKQLAILLAEHSAQHHGVVLPNDQRGAQLAYLVRAGCTVAPDAYLFAVIDRAIVAEEDKLLKHQ